MNQPSSTNLPLPPPYVASTSDTLHDPSYAATVDPYVAYSHHHKPHYSTPHHTTTSTTRNSNRQQPLYFNNKNQPHRQQPFHRANNNNTSTSHSPPPSHSIFHQQMYNEPPRNNTKCLLCQLCNNTNPNPWHTTENCPLKDPTFIIHKGIHENVMQHNSLHGKTNKQYNKNMDLPNNSNKPLPANLPTARQASLDDDHPYQPNITFGSSDHPSNLLPPYSTAHHDIEEPPSSSTPTTVIDTTTFAVPPIPTVNTTTVPPLPTSTESYTDHSNSTHTYQDLIFDPTDYLHFNS